jgi:hypothetical protein
MIEHVERVASALPPHARRTALLHEILELSPAARGALRAAGLSRSEMAAVRLLTHCQDESYEIYMRRIAAAAGQDGELARTVKIADLNDNLSHALIPAGAPQYVWAREQTTTITGQWAK